MSEQPSVVRQLAVFVNALALNQTPEEVVTEAKRCVLDTLGVVVAGQSNTVTAGVREHALESYGSGDAHIVGLTETLHPMAAALANGTAAHANDFDDTSYTGIMHGSAVVLPAALALVEQRAATGTALLEAFIAGVEIEYAIAELFSDHIYFKGWWTTAVYGTLGAAAAGAKMLGLDVDQTAQAIVMAAVTTSGMKASFGTDSKPLGVGIAACRGLECALLAARGLSGPENAFEDDRGLFKLLNDNQHKRNYDLRLNQRWRLLDPGILFKSYPVCSAAQAGVELTGMLMQRHRLVSDDISRIVCEVPKLVEISLVYNQPETVRQAQFSMPFAVACMLVFGDLRLDHLSAQVLADPRVQAQMKKVSMTVPDYLLNDPGVAERCPEGAGIILHTTGGSEFKDFLERPTGMPGNPVSTPALIDKFVKCLKSKCNHPQARLVAEEILMLENCSNLSLIIQKLANRIPA